MASFAVAGHLSYCCFLLLIAFSPLQAQARESQFFSKATRFDTTTTTTAAKEEQLPLAKKEEPVQYLPDYGNGYGLYGRGQPKLPPATTANPSAATYNYNSGAGENFNAEKAPSEFPNNEFTGAVNYENKEINAGGYTNGGGSYNRYNKDANARHPTNGNEREQYGMSDTRFLENGRYFYDLNAEESYANGANNPARGNPRAYGSFGGAASGGTFGNGGYSYGNSNRGSTGFEENTSVEGYQNNTQEGQEEYAP